MISRRSNPTGKRRHSGTSAPRRRPHAWPHQRERGNPGARRLPGNPPRRRLPSPGLREDDFAHAHCGRRARRGRGRVQASRGNVNTDRSISASMNRIGPSGSSTLFRQSRRRDRLSGTIRRSFSRCLVPSVKTTETCSIRRFNCVCRPERRVVSRDSRRPSGNIAISCKRRNLPGPGIQREEMGKTRLAPAGGDRSAAGRPEATAPGSAGPPRRAGPRRPSIAMIPQVSREWQWPGKFSRFVRAGKGFP